MATTKLDPAGESSVADRAAEEIRRAIRDGHYRPGDRLVERKLAAEFGMSHIPIREALARLNDEGLVERLPRRGARVADLSVVEIEEIGTLRTLLEESAVLRVQERLNPEREAELRGIVERMEGAAAKGKVERVFELDREFHARLWEYSDNATLVAVMEQLLGRLEAFLRAATINRPPEEMPEHAQAHRDLLEAVLSQEPKVARRTVTAHIDNATERLRALRAIEVEAEL